MKQRVPRLYQDDGITLRFHHGQKPSRFYRWLMAHASAHTPLGDLARDAFDDFRGYGIMRRGLNWDGTLRMLRRLVEDEGNENVKRTMADVVSQYRAHRKAKKEVSV